MKPYNDLIEILKKYKPKKFMIDTTPSMVLSSDRLTKKESKNDTRTTKCNC